MLKKYLLIGILVVTVALVISAFTLVSIDRSRSNGLQVGQSMSSVITDKAYESHLLRDSLSSASSETNFRIAHMWNGIFIPSMDVTGLLALPAADSSSSTDVNFRIAHMWNGIFIPSMDVTGSLGVAR